MLEVRNICKSYGKGGLWNIQPKPVLHDVSFHIQAGATVGLVGESGSGKSTLSRIVLGLERPDSGTVLLEGQAVPLWLRGNPGRMSVVFQDYTTSVNPAYTVRSVIREPLLNCGKGASSDKAVLALMDRVGLAPNLADRLPHEVSGGQLQRVCIARAIATDPRFVVFDEAISSLDVSVQTRILDLLRELKGNMTYFFIAHDLQAVTYLCDDILFMHQGHIVEQAAGSGLASVSHPYAQKLVSSAILFRSSWNG